MQQYTTVSRRELTLKEYNESRNCLLPNNIMSGKEYRRMRRKDRRK